jgi:hypothetical protein
MTEVKWMSIDVKPAKVCVSNSKAVTCQPQRMKVQFQSQAGVKQ